MKTKATLLFITILNIGFSMNAQDSLPKEIKAGKEKSKTRNEIRMPQIDNYELLKCDFHIHTIFSDGIVWPSLRVREAWEEGLDAIAITDHIEGQPSKTGVEKGNHNYSYEAARDEADRRGMILIRGGEITRSMPPGHLNALFINDVNILDRENYMEAIEEAHKQGAFIFWNHPGWGTDEIKWHDVHETFFQKGWLNGIEVFNELEWYPQALNWANEKNLAIISNSDIHDVNDRFYDFNQTDHRPMTLVLAKERSEEGVREALFDRRTIAYFFSTLMGKEEYLSKFWKNAVEIFPPHYTTTDHRFVHIKNKTDVPFKLKKEDTQAKGFPDEITIPAEQTILVTLPGDTEKPVNYEIENMIITPNKKLSVKLF